MLRYVNAALVKLNEKRSDVLLNSDGSEMLPFSTIADLGDIVVFGSEWLETLASRVVYLIYIEDSQDDKNLEMAGQFLSAYQRGVGLNG